MFLTGGSRAAGRMAGLVAGLAAALVAAAGCGGTSPSAAPHPSPSVSSRRVSAALPLCAPHGLRAAARYVSAPPGEGEAYVVLSNVSGRSCRTRGYPGLLFENGLHRRLHVTLQHGGSPLTDDPGPRTLVLDAEGSVSASLEYGDVRTGRACQQVSYLLITPPAGHQGVPTGRVRPHPLTVCQAVRVTALVAGFTGSFAPGAAP